MSSDQAPICNNTTCPETQTTSEYDLDTNKAAEVESWVNKLSDSETPEHESEEESEEQAPVPEEASSADPVGSDEEHQADEQDEAEEEEEDATPNIFVVMMDSTPVYWAGDRRSAEVILERVAEEIVMKYVDTHHVTRDNWADNVQIYGSKKNSIFNWGAALLHTASLHEVAQCSLV
jgi:hypothetical protein